jgi:hypothetical protein
VKMEDRSWKSAILYSPFSIVEFYQ